MESNNSVKILILGNGAIGSPASLLVKCGDSGPRILINCSENTQRLLEEQGEDVTSITDIFVSEMTWDHFGGLPGCMLTMQTKRCKSLNIHGPKEIENLFGKMGSFVHLHGLAAKFSDCSLTQPLVNIEYSSLLETPTRIGQKQAKHHLQMTSICYVGRFKEGEDDLEYTSKVVYVECPSILHVDSLHHSNLLELAALSPDAACVVFHACPKSVLEDKRYKEWMSNFNTETLHVLLNTSNTFVNCTAARELQNKLRVIGQQTFRAFPKNDPAASNQTQEAKIHRASVWTTVEHEQNKWVLKHQDKEGDENVEIHAPEDLEKNDVTEYPRIILLGTGGSMPRMLRNVSSILIEMRCNDFLILDCGEGTHWQMVQLFGVKETNRILRNTQIIFISHLHADHHVGLVGILERRRHLLRHACSPVMLLGPEELNAWLSAYHSSCSTIQEEYVLTPTSTLRKIDAPVNTILGSVLSELGLRIRTCKVEHPSVAHGIAVEHQTGWKITYSGDSAPCGDLVAIGMNSTFLIHEATMGDEYLANARRTCHSTVSQAINIGKAMNAQFIVLTHISQRYNLLPPVPVVQNDNVVLALDNMELTLGVMPLLVQQKEQMRTIVENFVAAQEGGAGM